LCSGREILQIYPLALRVELILVIGGGNALAATTDSANVPLHWASS
jgi:hypothetical protein